MFALLLFLSCSTEPVCEVEESSSYVWGGFGYEWETLSHRLSLLKGMMTETGGAEVGMIGGDWSTGATWSDVPSFRLHTQAVKSSQVHVVHGATVLSMDRNEETLVSEELAIPAGLEGENASVVLRGIRLNADVPQGEDYPSNYDPALGYTSSGLRYGVGDATVEADMVSFPVTGQLFWGPQDREDMNEALKYAQSELEIGWTVIFHSEPREDYTVSGSAVYPRTPPNSEHPSFGAEDLSFGPVASVGFAGIRNVSLRLQDQEGTDQGSYWRRVGFELRDLDQTEPYGYAMATNSSLLEEIAVTASVEAQLSWFPVTEECASVDIDLIEGSHDVGEASFP
jgi:hypothetical protein